MGHASHDSHGHDTHPAPPAWTAGPERIALLRKMHSLGLYLGLALWPVVFIALAMAANRIHSANDPEGMGLPPTQIATILLIGLLFGLATHAANRDALKELDGEVKAH